ncbi:MAG: HU family DNA-binding protein [Clostridia bacterium]|nr:HU family DNA-binding protein [Clostridia bacterium]
MNKTQFISAVAKKAAVDAKTADACVNAVIAVVEASLKKGEKVQITGFGTFDVRKRSARTGKNPRTGEAVKIKASKAPAFKAGQTLKNAVNKK